MAWLWAPSEHLFWDLVWAATRQLCSLLNAPHRRFRRGGGRGKVHDEGSCKDVLSLRRCSGTVSLSLLLSCTRRINGSTCVIKLKKEKNSNSNSKRIKQIREIAAVVGRQRPSPRQLDLSFFFFLRVATRSQASNRLAADVYWQSGNERCSSSNHVRICTFPIHFQCSQALLRNCLF